jgi:hypothetical protein
VSVVSTRHAMRLMASHSSHQVATIQAHFPFSSMGIWGRTGRGEPDSIKLDRPRRCQLLRRTKNCGDRDSLQRRAREISASSASRAVLTHETSIRLLASPRSANWDIQREAVGLRRKRVDSHAGLLLATESMVADRKGPSRAAVDSERQNDWHFHFVGPKSLC